MIREGRNIRAKWFDTTHLMSNIKVRSVKGGANTVFAQLLSFSMSMVSTAIMGRLVAPESFGVVAMVTAVAGFVTIFMDLGFSSAVIQKKAINQKQVSTLFWVNVLIGLGIAGLIVLLAPGLVSFYNEPRLLHITYAYALSVFLNCVALQHNALLKRQMRFKQISSIMIIATAISVLVGIGMALTGFDYWAIIGITVSFALVNSVLTWIYCDWRPRFVFQLSKVKRFLRFGSGITGFELVNYFSRNLDNILIGKRIGAAALGLYSKSYQLLMLPITQLRGPLNTVALPALSALRGQDDRYHSFYRRYVFLLAFFSMPLVLFLAIFSREVILVVLGEKWVEAAYIFQLLAIASLIQPVAGTRGIVMITMGHTRKYFIWGLVNAIFSVSGYYIGVNWGVAGVAISYIIVNYVLLLPSLYWSFKGSPITVSSFFGEIGYPLLFSLGSACVCYAFKSSVGPIWSNLALALVGAVVGGAVYIVLWLSTKHTRSKLQAVLEIQEFIRK